MTKYNITEEQMQVLFEVLNLSSSNVTGENLQDILRALGIHKDYITPEQADAIFGALGIDKATAMSLLESVAVHEVDKPKGLSEHSSLLVSRLLKGTLERTTSESALTAIHPINVFKAQVRPVFQRLAVDGTEGRRKRTLLDKVNHSALGLEQVVQKRASVIENVAAEVEEEVRRREEAKPTKRRSNLKRTQSLTQMIDEEKDELKEEQELMETRLKQSGHKSKLFGKPEQLNAWDALLRGDKPNPQNRDKALTPVLSSTGTTRAWKRTTESSSFAGHLYGNRGGWAMGLRGSFTSTCPVSTGAYDPLRITR